MEEEAPGEFFAPAPLLQRARLEPPYFPGFIGEFENPVNGDIVAFDHRGHRLEIDMGHARQNVALAGHQQIPADALGGRLLLLVRFLLVTPLDSAAMLPRLYIVYNL